MTYYRHDRKIGTEENSTDRAADKYIDSEDGLCLPSYIKHVETHVT